MDLNDTHRAMRLPEDSAKGQRHGSTMTDGPTTTAKPRGPRVVSVTTKKQALWLKQLMQRKQPQNISTGKWQQIVMPRGTATTKINRADALEINPQGSYKSPIELSKKYPEGYVVIMGRDSAEAVCNTSTTKSQDDLTAEAFSRPASKECIIAHLIRMAQHKPIPSAARRDSDQGDDTQTMYMISDYTERLLAEKTREVDLFLACEHFIEDDSSDFFPSYAKLLKATRAA